MKSFNLLAILFFSIFFIACDDDNVTETTAVEQWTIFREDTIENIGHTFKVDGLFSLDFTQDNFSGFGKFAYNFNDAIVSSNKLEILFENNYPVSYTDPDIFFRMEDKDSRSYVEYSGSWEIKDKSFKGLLIVGFENNNPNSQIPILRHFHDNVILTKK